MMSELTLQQVSYRYPGGSRYALDGISGTFSAGKLYAVIGPSGSGKSTLLSLMAGLDLPDYLGKVKSDRQDAAAPEPPKA